MSTGMLVDIVVWSLLGLFYWLMFGAALVLIFFPPKDDDDPSVSG